MIEVKIDEELALEMLMDRLKGWTQDKDILDLYRIMYENYVDAFADREFDPDVIVANDWVNYTSVLRADEISESDWKKICELGVGDCSCEDLNNSYSYIEAINEEKGICLVRW